MFSTYVPNGPVERAVVKAWNEYLGSLEEGDSLDVGESTAKCISAALKAQRELDIKETLKKP